MRLIIAIFVIFQLGCAAKRKAEDAPMPAALPYISNMRQLTFEGKRAGEGYFSEDGRYLVFQSERESNNPFYQIYLMDMQTGALKRVSPGKGKTTCAWIKPDNKKVMFASTHADPKLQEKVEAELAERKNPKSKYNWSFDEAYDIYETDMNGRGIKNLTRKMGYDAEGSYSPDGQWIAFASNRAAYSGVMTDEEKKHFARDPSYMMDIYIMRADGSQVKRLTKAPGYDGGPFFSPDGKRLTFRRFSADGHSAEVYTIGVDGSDERQITQMKAMSWAPFYHPSGDYLIFATNKEGYQNFELYIVDTQGLRTPVRASAMAGFDGLPVFAPDGRTLVWTHSNERGEAQLYRADWDDQAARRALGLSLAEPRLPQLAPAIRAADAASWVGYLASEHFEGRMTGSPKESEYLGTIGKRFFDMGLEPGASRTSYTQSYEFTSGVELGDNNSLTLTIGGVTEKPAVGGDWIPLSYSKTGEFPQAPVVFAGYGIVATANGAQAAYDSYTGLDVKDKWVAVFLGLPDEIPNERRFHLHIYSKLQHKAMVARQNGAVGLIVIDDTKMPASPLKLSFEGRDADAGLPVVRVSPALADRMLKAAGTSRAEWTMKLAKGETSGVPLAGVSAEARVSLKFKKSKSENVLARLNAPGSAAPTVIIGAHIDHLGHGENGNSLSRDKGKAHLGADDNASGVAAVMEIAHAISDKVRRGEVKLKQNIVFALWTGEELGILGSKHFVNGMRPEDRVSAYLNLDMVGRLREQLSIQGVGSAGEWRGLIERVNSQSPLTLAMQDDPYLPTDAISFYLKGIPSISFFTGSHSEYHTERDTADLVNNQGIAQISAWVTNLALTLATAPKPLVTYRKVEGGKRPTEGRGFRLYLGTIPDYTQEGKVGVLISGTSKNSPAEKAGLVAGDVIVELGGIKIQNLQDYVYCLQALKANEKTKVRIVRAGREKVLDITPVPKSAH